MMWGVIGPGGGVKLELVNGRDYCNMLEKHLLKLNGLVDGDMYFQ